MAPCSRSSDRSLANGDSTCNRTRHSTTRNHPCEVLCLYNSATANLHTWCWCSRVHVRRRRRGCRHRRHDHARAGGQQTPPQHGGGGGARARGQTPPPPSQTMTARGTTHTTHARRGCLARRRRRRRRRRKEKPGEIKTKPTSSVGWTSNTHGNRNGTTPQ